MRDLPSDRDTSLGLWSDMRRSVQNFFGGYMPGLRNRPNIDVREEKNRYIVEAEIPGMDEKDIDVSVQNNMLSISSKREETTEEKREGYIMRERRSSTFSRHFTLPDDADREHIEASYNQGLLTLSIPKIAQEKQIKHIRVGQSERPLSERMSKTEAAPKQEAASRTESEKSESSEKTGKSERTKKDTGAST